jgi:hypothetical protein
VWWPVGAAVKGMPQVRARLKIQLTFQRFRNARTFRLTN